jgi:hypothetical protein
LRETSKITLLDDDLNRLLDAWPKLPDVIRAGILAMVEAAANPSKRD